MFKIKNRSQKFHYRVYRWLRRLLITVFSFVLNIGVFPVPIVGLSEKTLNDQVISN